MKLGSLKSGRDGCLVGVSDDLAWGAAGGPQNALQNVPIKRRCSSLGLGLYVVGHEPVRHFSDDGGVTFVGLLVCRIMAVRHRP